MSKFKDVLVKYGVPAVTFVGGICVGALCLGDAAEKMLNKAAQCKDETTSDDQVVECEFEVKE